MALKIIVISGPIGFEVTVQDVRDKLNEANGEDVEMQIASPGGFVSPGLEIFNLIRDYPGNIDFRIMGQVASMGSYLTTARAGRGKISVHDNSVYMMHKPASFAVGNDDEVMKVAEHLRGLTGILALGYSAQSRKSKEKMIELMNDVTFYYGSEIVDAGFADEVIVTDKDNDKKDKASAIIEAKAAIENCVALMRDSEFAKEDTLKAVAYLSEHNTSNENENPGSATGSENNINNCTNCGETQKEENKMDLAKLLNENPEAKSEYDKAIVVATQAGADAIQAKIKKVIPVLLSVEYPQAIKDLGGKVLEGTEEIASFTAVVTMKDADIESAKAAAAAGETGKETPGAAGAAGATSEDGSINNAADFEATAAAHKATNDK